jgi:hypothetical protein
VALDATAASAASSPALFSMPLAYPSTLDHRRRVRVLPPAASYVEGLWSPSLGAIGEIGRQKHTLLFWRNFHADAQRAFLSQAGPRFLLDLLQAGHHPLRSPRFRLRNDEGDPVGRPRVEPILRQD